jgi:hypothetical protein
MLFAFDVRSEHSTPLTQDRLRLNTGWGQARAEAEVVTESLSTPNAKPETVNAHREGTPIREWEEAVATSGVEEAGFSPGSCRLP